MSVPGVDRDRGIDHLVLAVRDLDAAAARYEALGFTLTPRAEHPWGTANRLVQLDGSFLELLTVADPARIVEHGPRQFSFGAWNRDWLASREGLSMLVFEGHDTLAERDQFAASGVLRDLDPFDFERMATLPDGTRRRVAFSLAFAVSERLPAAPMFTCRQHAPELFWNPAYQRHANGARAIGEVVMVADDPPALGAVFAAIEGETAVARDGDGLRVDTARGLVRVMTPAAYRERYAQSPRPDAPAGAHFAAFSVVVDDPAALARRLRRAGIETLETAAGRVVPGDALHAVALAFAGA